MSGAALNPDRLLMLLQQRFNLPSQIAEDAEFKDQLDKGYVCYGDFNRRYNKKYVQPIKQRVLKVLTQWVRDDPFNEMKKPVGGGVPFYERIRRWADNAQEAMLGDGSTEYTSPFVKSAMRQLMVELDKIAESNSTDFFIIESPIQEMSPPNVLTHLVQLDQQEEFSFVTLHPIGDRVHLIFSGKDI